MHDAQSWKQLNEIANYFKTDLHPINTDDWDAVEEMISKIIKSSRAGKSTKEMTEMITEG